MPGLAHPRHSRFGESTGGGDRRENITDSMQCERTYPHPPDRKAEQRDLPWLAAEVGRLTAGLVNPRLSGLGEPTKSHRNSGVITTHPNSATDGG